MIYDPAKKYMILDIDNNERICVDTFWMVLRKMFSIYFDQNYSEFGTEWLADVQESVIWMRILADDFEDDDQYSICEMDKFEGYIPISKEKICEMLRQW
jgi:hypothetical protein